MVYVTDRSYVQMRLRPVKMLLCHLEKPSRPFDFLPSKGILRHTKRDP